MFEYLLLATCLSGCEGIDIIGGGQIIEPVYDYEPIPEIEGLNESLEVNESDFNQYTLESVYSLSERDHNLIAREYFEVDEGETVFLKPVNPIRRVFGIVKLVFLPFIGTMLLLMCYLSSKHLWKERKQLPLDNRDRKSVA